VDEGKEEGGTPENAGILEPCLKCNAEVSLTEAKATKEKTRNFLKLAYPEKTSANGGYHASTRG